MRPVMHSDVTAVARVLLGQPAPLHDVICARLLRHADWADRYTRRLGKPHPQWGNGTLLGATQKRRKLREPTFDDPAYCLAFQLVLSQLAQRKRSEHL